MPRTGEPGSPGVAHVSCDAVGGIGRSLGDSLREHRESAGYSQRELATLLGWPNNARVSRYESGARTPSPDVLVKILDALDVTDTEREHLLGLVQRVGPGQWVTGLPSAGKRLAQLIGYERAASRITDVAPLLIPGLLQTAEYARAVLGDGPDTKKRVSLRMERAEILTRQTHPVKLRALIDSSVLTRPIASPSVMRSQLLHLRKMADLPTVTIQIVPAEKHGWNPILAGPFILIESEEGPVVHLEHHRASAFLWSDEVRAFMAAIEEIECKAMTPEQSAEVIAELAGTETS